ncbi:MAG: Ig-like domain-containing protein, partial [Candidatus Zixiibacteriota bacterium]
DIEEEPIGVTTQDVILDSVILKSENINFILAQRDTIAPSLVNCQALDRGKIRLDFNERLQRESLLNLDNYSVHLQKSPGEKLEISSVYFQGDDSKSVFLVTEDTEQGGNYQVLVSDLRDESGNEIDSASNSCLFWGTGLPDTIGLTILYTQPKDREINVPLKSDVKIFFSEPPEKKSLKSNFILKDENEEPVKGISLWESDVVFTFMPDSLLSSMTTYKVKLKDMYDISNNPLSDSFFEISFTTLNKDTLGSVSGEVKILREKPKGSIVVVLKKIDSDEILYEKVIEEPGEFLFDMVLPGKYLAKAYIDKDKDKKHGFGEIFPYIPAEPYTTFPDTIPVRSRWETEKIDLIFK